MSATLTPERIEADELELLRQAMDAAPPPCTWTVDGQPCVHEAAWVADVPCPCAFTIPTCERCRTVVVTAPDYPMRHRVCGVTVAAADLVWRPI